MEVKAVSLNFGDVNGIAGKNPGDVPGWDAAGVVVQAAADGSGPAVGTRVVSFGNNGAWAERRAVRTRDVGVVPDKVDLSIAASVPVAGVTGVQSLRASGPVTGKRVLITGASGGVGRYTIQLAALEGAHVIAAARRGDGLAELGAKEVVSTLDGLAPVDVVLDTVGGPQLVAAWNVLAPGGVIQSIGWTSLEPAPFPPYATVGPAKSLQAFESRSPFGPDIETVLRLVAEGKLEVNLGWHGSWHKFEDAIAALRGRQVSGKAVLDID
jgi:NADPH:quinone reductase-like Zn-dependent oxidoreductase